MMKARVAVDPFWDEMARKSAKALLEAVLSKAPDTLGAACDRLVTDGFAPQAVDSAFALVSEW